MNAREIPFIGKKVSSILTAGLKATYIPANQQYSIINDKQEEVLVIDRMGIVYENTWGRNKFNVPMGNIYADGFDIVEFVNNKDNIIDTSEQVPNTNHLGVKGILTELAVSPTGSFPTDSFHKYIPSGQSSDFKVLEFNNDNYLLFIHTTTGAAYLTDKNYDYPKNKNVHPFANLLMPVSVNTTKSVWQLGISNAVEAINDKKVEKSTMTENIDKIIAHIDEGDLLTATELVKKTLADKIEVKKEQLKKDLFSNAD